MKNHGRGFAGRLRDFSVPCEPLGTDFQLSVWRELEAIPHGIMLVLKNDDKPGVVVNLRPLTPPAAPASSTS